MERASRSARVFAALLAGVAGTVLTTGSALADPTPSPPPHVPDANIRAGIVPILPATTDIPLPPSLVPLESESTAGGRITVSLSSDVLFDFDKATLTPHARRRITELAGRIRRTSGAVRVEGHTDAKGAPAYNLRLSRARAAAVKAALEQALAGSGVRIVAVGHGEARPVAPNTRPDGKDDPAGRAKNRRVTVTFQQS